MSSWGSLQDELKRKREEAEAARKQTDAASAGAGDGTKKYVRRGDVGKAIVTAQPATAPSSGVVTLEATAIPYSDHEVESRLRSYGLPVTLFGELPEQRARRLVAHEHRLHKSAVSVASAGAGRDISDTGIPDSAARMGLYDPDASGETRSLPPAKRRRLDADGVESSSAAATVDAEIVSEATAANSEAHAAEAGDASVAAAAERGASGSAAHHHDDEDDARSRGSRHSKDRSESRTKAADATRYRPVAGNPHANQHKYAYKWIRGMLNEWEDELSTRSAAEAASARGREEASLWQQSTQYVRPLLRRLKSKSVPADILKLVVEIVGHCEDREYAVAGDAYVRLAIGNAAWPIGVTAVGLHERAAREKVYEGRQAHVMHNEESRKYVTILKRLISLAQRKWPAEPSKSVYS